MLELGNRLKLTTGALCLLALLVLGYSGMKLSLLFDTPLIGVSSESRLAKQKWNRLETLVSGKGQKDWGSSSILLIKEHTKPEPGIEKTNPVQEIQQVVRYNRETLPRIGGIILTSDSPGEQMASVIINGDIYSENDEVSGYMIKKITKSGVSLAKNGKHFFIDAPKAPYSVDLGD